MIKEYALALTGATPIFHTAVDRNGITRRTSTYILPHIVGPARYNTIGSLLYRPDWKKSALHIHNIDFVNAIVTTVCDTPVSCIIIYCEIGTKD